MHELIQISEPTQEVKRTTGVLFVAPPYHKDPKSSRNSLDDSGMNQEIPRGALSVATLLSRDGFPAEVAPMDAFLRSIDIVDDPEEYFDPTVNEYTRDLEHSEHTRDLEREVIREGFDEVVLHTLQQLIEKNDPKVICFSYMFLPERPAVRKMVSFVREKYPDKVIVIGGNAATFDDRELLDPAKFGADVIVNYEGEWTMEELMKELDNANGNIGQVDLSRIKGISYWDKEQDKAVTNAIRERGNPEEVGAINYDLVTLPMGGSISDFNLSALLERGCLGSCVFCSSPKMWKHKITGIGLKNFKTELENIAKFVSERKEGEKTIGLFDDDILLELNGVPIFEIMRPVLQEIRAKYPNVSFVVQTRVSHLRGDLDPDLTKAPTGKGLNTPANSLLRNSPEVLRQMKECGIDLVLLGAETFSQAILDSINKQTRPEWVRNACLLLREAGIKIGMFYIVGLPGSTPERERESLEILRQLVEEGLIDELETHVFVPLPGSAAQMSERIRRTMKLDPDIYIKGPALINEDPGYEYINPETGQVVFSKAQITAIYRETQALAALLRTRQAMKGESSVIKS